VSNADLDVLNAQSILMENKLAQNVPAICIWPLKDQPIVIQKTALNPTEKHALNAPTERN
jgi:hypothetical protein